MAPSRGFNIVHYDSANVATAVLIILLVIINLTLFINGINLDCDNCKVTFKNVRISGIELAEPVLFAEVQAKELYESFAQGKCMIKFQKVQGYYYTE